MDYVGQAFSLSGFTFATAHTDLRTKELSFSGEGWSKEARRGPANARPPSPRTANPRIYNQVSKLRTRQAESLSYFYGSPRGATCAKSISFSAYLMDIRAGQATPAMLR